MQLSLQNMSIPADAARKTNLREISTDCGVRASRRARDLLKSAEMCPEHIVSGYD